MKDIKYLNSKPLISDSTQLGTVSLNVYDLNAQLDFYTRKLKMIVHAQDATSAHLGSEQSILLHLNKVDSRIRNNHSTGMYHFALLYPNETELAKAIAWLYKERVVNYPTDHGMSKTTYLKDPEGNDIELYIRTLDRARYVEINGNTAVLYNDGRMTDGRDALDLDELFKHIHQDTVLDTRLSGVTLGHMHLYGSGNEAMMHFYRDLLGFGEGIKENAFRLWDVGLSDSQNHVIAFNTWKGSNPPRYTPGTLGMAYFTIQLSKADYEAIITRLESEEYPYAHIGEHLKLIDPSGLQVILENN